MMLDGMDHHNTGLRDWFFRQAAFPHLEDNAERYFQRYYPQNSDQMKLYKQFIQVKRSGLSPFFEGLVGKYEIDRADVVGFTSMFSQTVSSIAMARIIKKRNPNVITLLGGANCESPMGQEIAKNIEHIDFVFSGPSLKSFPQFIGHLLDNEPEACHRINGVFSDKNSGSLNSGCGAATQLVTLGEETHINPVGDELSIDTEIELDYEPFLEDLKRDFPDNDVTPVLLFETSRGCWWGEKAHCTFCGLNGMSMNYRSMRPDLAIRQIRSLFKYSDRVSHFNCVDNILPKNYLKEVLPYLDAPPHLTIFYEVKADLSDEDMQALADARVMSIQPGVESLATSTLKLMRKGTNAFQNISLLKNCAKFGIFPGWNLLIGFPGEEDDVYRKYVQELSALVHLPPPGGPYPVRFDRFSPYFVQAREYGLDLHPVDYYELIYPFGKESLANLAYYFTDHNINARYFTTMLKWIDKIKEQVNYWSTRWNARDGSLRAELYVKHRGKSSTIYDSRTGVAQEHNLDDISMQLLDYLDKPRRLSELTREFSHIADFDPERALADLMRRRLLFQEGDRYISVVLQQEPAPMNGVQAHPN
jgi:magnesium-protoporphyrin IX monomethyl ester (oxidative) cyclase